MNEEQLIEFVNWLPTAVPEFQNASPDQIVQSLNQMAESEEGQQMLSQLFTAFQESKQAGNSQMFKKGGKMAAFVNKYSNGGCVSCKKKEILQGGMVNKMAEKMQDGGDTPKISRRDAIRAGMSNKGYTREQANIALANAMNTGRNMGLRGRELRQWARRGFVPDAPEIDQNVEVSMPELEQVPIDKFIFDKQSLNPIKKVDVIPQTFNQAFRGARKNKWQEFTWNGKRYTTELAPKAPKAPKAPEVTLDVDVPQLEDVRVPVSSFRFSDDQLNPIKHVDKMPIAYPSANSRGLVRGMDLGFLFNRRKMQKGGELATMTSAETANNIGLIPMAQGGLSLEPEVKPGGLRGLFWRPTFVPRVDASGTEMGTDWTGERATYYKPNGSLVQILTKQYTPGNTAKTTRTIRYPFTPMADTTTVVRTSSDDDSRKVDNSKFNGVFSLNFDKKNK